MYPKQQRQKFAQRTREQVDKAVMSAKPTNTPLSSPYLSCRYNPFSRSSSGTKIPDGKGVNIIVRDWKMVYDLTVGAAGGIIRIGPTFPYVARFRQDVGFIVNGVTISNSNTTTPPPTGSGDFIWYAPNNSVSGTGNAGVTVFQATGARIITLGYRLYYTGAASAATGLIIVDNLPWNIDANSPSNVELIQYGVDASGTAATNVTIAAGTVPQVLIDEPSASSPITTPTAQQVVLRPENGLHGILKYQRSADEHDFEPWYDAGAIMTSQYSSSATSTLPTLRGSGNSQATGNNVKGISLFDRQFQMANIKITGAGTYRLEVTVCMEQALSNGSPLIDMAKTSPPFNRAVMEADAVLNASVAPASFLESPVAAMPRAPPPSVGRRRSARLANNKTKPSNNSCPTKSKRPNKK